MRRAGHGGPGPVDPGTGIVLEAVNLRWKNEPIAELLGKHARQARRARQRRERRGLRRVEGGLGKGATDLMGCWVGTGVGGGLVLDGKIFYGHHLTAGEVGHMILMPHNPPGVRSVEHNCSRTAMCNRVRQLIEARARFGRPRPGGRQAAQDQEQDDRRGVRLGDELVVEIVHDAAWRLGTILAGITTLLSLEKIILGGGLTEAIGEPCSSSVSRPRSTSTPSRMCASTVEVVASALEDNAGVIGAALIARDRVAG
jgi:glucokinase